MDILIIKAETTTPAIGSKYQKLSLAPSMPTRAAAEE